MIQSMNPTHPMLSKYQGLKKMRENRNKKGSSKSMGNFADLMFQVNELEKEEKYQSHSKEAGETSNVYLGKWDV